ncbi:MACPF domain-containing protein NSL1 [Platanthera zijinensis]|uniref:MACPF domain-containing protein NSL1 n=1 Tax=Platanthera zijinensis TaxID=2320716 RepID=A0AAP0BI57_9ASPA
MVLAARSPAPAALEAVQSAVAAIGCGYDLAVDLRLARCKTGPSGSRLIEMDRNAVEEGILWPGVVVVHGVPMFIRWDKGKRTRFQVLSLHEVDSGRRRVTGIRLYLEGRRNDFLAVHLQHLSALPRIFHLSDEHNHATDDLDANQRSYFEPFKWARLSHACIFPVQYSGAHIGASSSIVTSAWLEVREISTRRVLFLRLGFSHVASMRIRRSEWDGPTSIPRKSDSISSFISSRLSSVLPPPPKPRVDVNSAICPGGPPTPVRVTKLAKFVDTTEIARGLVYMF